MVELSIYLFGSIRVLQTDQELLIRPASQMLLLYLLLHREKHHRREELTNVFWGDISDSKARRCLNTALWRLRHDLSDTDMIASSIQGDLIVRLRENCYLDVIEFESLALSGLKKTPTDMDNTAIKHLEQAVGMYQGDLAESCFYDWVLPERERLRTLYLDTLTLLMYAYSEKAAYPQAFRMGHLILQSDPLREDIHRHLIRLYIVTDQRSRALQQYMICWKLLQDELHLTPMPETTALYEQIQGKAPFSGLTQEPEQPPVTLNSLPPNLDRLKNKLYDLQIEIQDALNTIQSMTEDRQG